MSRRSYVEFRLGLALTGWAASGSNFTRTVTAAELTFAGVIRPIVGAVSMIHPRELVRVERTADLTTGTFFWDDAALVAGGSATLTVRLPTATDPDDGGLVVHLLFCSMGGDEDGNAEVHPLLGENKYLNPGFETWGGGNPTSWTEYGAGAVQETTIVLDGLSSAKIGSATIAAGALDGAGQSRLGVQGAQYRIAGYYQTPLTGQAPEVEVRLRVGDGTSWVMSDGRTLTAVDGGFRLADTYGETKRFLFDFVWTGATTTTMQADLLLYNSSASAKQGFLYGDRMNFRRIWRWNQFDTNLSAESIPELSIQSQSINFGPKTIGFGSVTLLDGDGELAKAFASLLVLQKPAQVYVGGSMHNGEEIHRDDWRGVFPALIRKPEISAGQITLELENAKALTLGKAPENTHRISASTPDLAISEEGLPKPLVFGLPYNDDGTALRHIIPGVRVGLTANGYGEYRYLDETIPVRDNVDVDMTDGPELRVYPNRELADLDLQGYTITDDVNDFELDENNTLWRVLRDLRNMQYDPSGKDVGTGLTFPFGIGGAVLFADLNVSGPAYKVADDLETAMNAAAGVANITVTYSESTHLFTVARGGGTLDLFMTAVSMSLAHVTGWKLLGYDTKSDLTGSLSYPGDEPTFTNPETDHVIRFAGGGYQDDATGSIAGLANAGIDTWPAIASWLLQKAYNVPASQVNVAEFSAARSISLSNDLAVVFGTFDHQQGTELLAIAEQVGVMNIVPDGEGVWRCIKHVASSAGAREFFDEDYMAGTWRMWLDPTAVYKAVKIFGDWNPSLKRMMTYNDATAVTDDFIPIKHGEERTLELQGYIERQYIVNGTCLVGNYYGKLVGQIPRVVSFEATSKLVDLLPGMKILLNRTGPGVLDPTGALSSVAFRIVDLTHRYSTDGVSRCVAVEDVVFLT